MYKSNYILLHLHCIHLHHAYTCMNIPHVSTHTHNTDTVHWPHKNSCKVCQLHTVNEQKFAAALYASCFYSIYILLYICPVCVHIINGHCMVKHNYIICMYALLPSLASIVNNCTMCLPCMWLCVMCVCVWGFVSAAQNNAMKM